MIFYEDMTSGKVIESGTREVTKEEIIDFAKVYDPQPFHLDEEAAKSSLLGGLAASGWQTASLTQRLVHDVFIGKAASLGSPGIEELKWLKPVRPGDRLNARIHIRDKRISKSRPEMGLVNLFVEVGNASGELVMTQQNVLLMGRRDMPQKPVERSLPSGAGNSAATKFPDRPLKPWPPSQYLEDLRIGEEITLGTELFTAESIISFASAYDPQPFHLDEEAARQSHFGRLAASGWQTGAIWMKHYMIHRDAFFKEFADQGGLLPELGPSPGFVDLKWPHPVYAGDRITYTGTVESVRPTSRPGWGLVTSINKAVNQDGRLVFSFKPVIFWQTRP
ncbi:MaoC family dehydratase [Beijerinckia indica]|uniref:MaoC domain protein dehydratase n=1 Tax=Beijerinckia indica subsp. indica (strain ATCC 9039 / DSM 1715 / NCIMB 8712) TaxID=395963 RepID=B2IBV4_BEII9|nr:MaoC family dehydratase [Beijerinckia indica]ACB93826.1 MaoC domain protein dehydratase [Beijerinckia indica subsp. indica ATCC 9039]